MAAHSKFLFTTSLCPPRLVQTEWVKANLEKSPQATVAGNLAK